eukprot:EG_transcript_25516
MRVGFVHAYETKWDPRRKGVVLGPLMEAVCQEVAKCGERFDSLFLAGGQHNPDVQELLADTMKRRLLELGVSPAKLVVWADVPALAKYMPARDTAEEVVLLGHLLRSGRYPESAEVTVLIAEEFAEQVEHVHRHLGLRCAVLPLTTGCFTAEAARQCRAFAQYVRTDPLRLAHGPSLDKRRARTRVPAGDGNEPLIALPEEEATY